MDIHSPSSESAIEAHNTSKAETSNVSGDASNQAGCPQSWNVHNDTHRTFEGGVAMYPVAKGCNCTLVPSYIVGVHRSILKRLNPKPSKLRFLRGIGSKSLVFVSSEKVNSEDFPHCSDCTRYRKNTLGTTATEAEGFIPASDILFLIDVNPKFLMSPLRYHSWLAL
ncbi:hypothetical protein Moror_835 [Moniliophthora roreri MCA 2997]|uniref:Uncharacterized protein n=1 Tax=Moniliophthora roreri (strain MCA 2997) TaxID=1381753 RepID=V2XBI1_MONRO|nr:hypothetical protein Moror_835 [Moniliophthora roreri MCA 2997]